MLHLEPGIGIGTRTDGSKLSSYVKLRGSGSYLGLFVEYGVAPHLISVSEADKPVRQTRHTGSSSPEPPISSSVCRPHVSP